MKIIIAAAPFALTLTTNLADGLLQFADFLKEADQMVQAIAPTQ